MISKFCGYGLLALVLGAVGFTAFTLLGNHELRSKTEWGCLQAVEYEWRHKDAVKYPMLQQRDGYRVACVSSADGNQKIWILLTPQFNPLYKQIPPDLDYRLTAGDLASITGYCAVHPTVMAELRRHTF